MKKTGKIFLVGAGPGDPGLLTVRGAQLIATCDVIVMDALVNRAIVADAAARVIDVGKRGRSRIQPGHGPRQSEINALLVRLARAGKTVVRLKGGDPFVFGRGSEEIETLRRRRIPYEIVPGVTSAVAAPAYAGIPVTDRRWSSQVTFVTGHESTQERESGGVDWSRISPSGTLVILMGVTGWPEVAAALRRHGWSAETPVAAIERGTTVRQRTIRATLARSADEFRKRNLSAPAVIVVGAVAALTDGLDWFRRERPLFGHRVVVTRASDAAGDLSDLLRAEGVEVIRCPLISVRPLTPALPTGRRFDWLLFLSANAVRHFSSLPGARALAWGARVLAVGPQTAEAARAAGWRVDAVPDAFRAGVVTRTLGTLRGARLLLPRAVAAPAEPVPALERRGALVTVLPVYETRPLRPTAAVRRAVLDGAEVVTFLSASTVDAFCRAFPRADRDRLFQRAVALSIGPTTTAALRRAGIRPVRQAAVSSRAGVLAALHCLFRQK